jgi:2-amino-4-hydroxy-6-hydroxymethyldihydropteridine diphosphokinase
MEQVWISLGSNVGDRLGQLRHALAALGSVGRLTAVSDAYETSPVGPVEQPWFLNAVAGVEVDDEQAPERLLKTLLALERAMGREREGKEFVPKGPRTIDLDIILYGSRVVDSPALKIPHPEMHRRRFVLEPLAQVAPEVIHPLLKRSALDLLRELTPELSSQVVRRFAALEYRR